MTNKFFERHVFFCTNQRPEGHPKGCCASKNSTVLRAYMKKKTKELVSDKKIRINASGCLDHCEFGPTLVVYPCLLYTSPSPRDRQKSRMPSSA